MASSPTSPLTTNTSCVTRWLADYRNRMLQANEDAAKNSSEIRKELTKYRKEIENLQATLLLARGEADQSRDAAVSVLNAELSAERNRVLELQTAMDQASDAADDARRQAARSEEAVRESAAELSETKEALQLSTASEERLLDELTERRANVTELEKVLSDTRLRAELAATDAAEATADLRTELANSVDALEDEVRRQRLRVETLQAEADAGQQVLQKAEQLFDAEVERQGQLLSELRSQNEALQGEARQLRALEEAERNNALPSFSNDPEKLPRQSATLLPVGLSLRLF